MLGTHKLGSSKATQPVRKNLCQPLTLYKREKIIEEKIKTIMHLAEHSSLKGMDSARAAII